MPSETARRHSTEYDGPPQTAWAAGLKRPARESIAGTAAIAARRQADEPTPCRGREPASIRVGGRAPVAKAVAGAFGFGPRAGAGPPPPRAGCVQERIAAAVRPTAGQAAMRRPACGSTDSEEVTNAYRGQARDRRRADRGSSVSSAMIVSEYRGLKVSELGEIRRNLRKQNVTYHVVKNRLMKIAARDAGVGSPRHPARGSHRGGLHQGRRGGCRQGGPRRVPAVPPDQGHRCGHRRSGRQRRRRHAALAAPRPRRSPGPGRRRDRRADGHDGRPVRCPAAGHRRAGPGPRRQRGAGAA